MLSEIIKLIEKDVSCVATYLKWTNRSSHCMCSKNFCNFHRKTTVLGSLFNKVVDLQAYNLLKKRLQHSCFSVHIAKTLRTPISKSIWMVPKTVSSDFSKFQEMRTWIRPTNNCLGTCWVWCLSYENLVHLVLYEGW